MNLLGTEIPTRTILLGVGIAVLNLFSLWFHSQAMSASYTPSSTIVCSLSLINWVRVGEKAGKITPKPLPRDILLCGWLKRY